VLLALDLGLSSHLFAMTNRKQRRIAAKQSLSQFDRHHAAGAAPADADLMDEARRQFHNGNGKRAEVL